MEKNKVLFALALIGIILLCGWVFVYSTDAVASFEGFDRAIKIRQILY